MAEISPLRRHMIKDMAVGNLSPATQQSPLSAEVLPAFLPLPDRLGRCPRLSVDLVATAISRPALNQIVCRFFYGVTLQQATVPGRITYARDPSKLPVVLSANEIAIPSLKSRTALTHRYAAGLLVSDVVLLKIADIETASGW